MSAENESKGFSAWTILDRLTGEIRTGNTVAHGEFMWTEGNYECDHNRVAEFYGVDSPEDQQARCEMMPDGTSRFVLLKLVNPDGTVELEGEF